MEFLIAINGEGRLVESVKGSSTRTAVTDKLSKAISLPESEIDVYHNHPKSKFLSSDDLSMLSYPGLRSITFYNKSSDGLFFGKSSLTKAGRKKLKQHSDQYSYMFTRRCLYSAFQLKDDHIYRVNLLIHNNIFSLEEANACGEAMPTVSAVESGLFIIDHNAPLPLRLDHGEFRAAINQMAEAINTYCCTREIRKDRRKP